MSTEPKSTSPSPTKQEPLEPFPNGEDLSSPLLNSVAELRGLSGALSYFTRRWNELQSHLSNILKSIDERSQELETGQPPRPEAENPDVSASPDLEPDDNPPTELQIMCQTMNGKNLRKYVCSHLADTEKLREEIPAAMKRAPDMGSLVLGCIGRFYLQGSRAYEKESPMVSVRQACVVILECFLIANGCSKNDPSVKGQAETAAIAWKNRLVQEGGIGTCKDVDAHALLLFVASFGIPECFGVDELCKLVQSSKISKESGRILRSSPFLQQKLEDVIQEMVKNDKHISAVEFACAFGIEEKYSPEYLVSSFINKNNQIVKQMRREGQGSRSALKAADEKQLAVLKSVVKCMEKHRLDPANFTDLKIEEKIQQLEKNIQNLGNKLNESKRKTVEQGGQADQLKTQEAKRFRPGNMRMLPQSAAHGHMAPPYPEHREQVFHNNNGLLSRNEYDGRYMGLIEGLPGILGSPDAAGRGSSYLGKYPIGNSDLSSFATETGNGIPLGGSGAGLSANRLAGSYGWHQGGAALAYNDDLARQNLMDYYNPSTEGRQGHGGAPSNRGGGSNLYQFADTI